FGGDYRSWEDQVRYFSRRYRVVAYNHRGYPPSSVPKAASDYSQDLLVADLLGLVKHLGLGPIHLVGCSMGANAARDFTLANPGLCRVLAMGRVGAGAVNRQQFLATQAATAEALDREGMTSLPRGFETLSSRASCAHLAREVMSKRKTVQELEAALRGLRVPTLIMVGDQDA